MKHKFRGEKLMCSNESCIKFRKLVMRHWFINKEMICFTCKHALKPFVGVVQARRMERIKKELEGYGEEANL